MALGTGLRAHELVALDVGDVFDAAGEPKRRVLLRVFKGDGRGDDDLQEVVLSENLRTKLPGLRAWKHEQGESLAPDAPLFVSQRGLRLSTRQLRHAFGIWQARARRRQGCAAHRASGRAERVWEIEAQLEKTLVAPLQPDYEVLLAAARERLVAGSE